MNRRKRSDVWLHFKDLPKERYKTAQCIYCKNKYSYEASVSNLKMHLKKVHPTIRIQRSKTPDELEVGEREPTPVPSTSTASNPIVIDDVSEALSAPSSSSSAPTTTSSAPTTTSSAPSTTSSAPGKRSQSSTIPIFVRKQMTKADNQTLDTKVFNLFIRDLQPFSIMEDEGFRDLMGFLAPDYNIPSRKYFSNSMLNSVYESTFESTLLKIAEAPSVCVTTDNWTSRRNQNYICVTAHYITKNFELASYVLECILFKGRHTAENLSTELKRIFRKWRIEDKILIVISDNASNIVKAVKDFLKLKHFGCFAHSLNLSVQNALLLKDVEELEEELYDDDEDVGDEDDDTTSDDIHEDVEDDDDVTDILQDVNELLPNSNIVIIVVKKTKKIVRYIRKSPQTAQKLDDSQRMLGETNPLCVIIDVKTRWNSTLQMLERFVKLKAAIRIVFANITVRNLEMLTEEEWRVAEELVELLKPFEIATAEMSGESYLTASKIIPISDGLKAHVETLLKEGKCPNTARHATVLLNQLNRRFKNLQRSTTIAACSFLDPRFKHHVFTDKEALNSIQREVTNWTAAVITQKAEEAKNKPTSEENPAKKKKRVAPYWLPFDRKVEASTTPQTNARAAAIIEIQKYISTPTLPREECPLKWWNENQHMFPNLSEVAKSKGCMVATSVPCERTYSTGGNVVTPRRARILPSKVGKVIFLNKNL